MTQAALDGRIVVNDLTKVFRGKIRAVDRLTFTVEPGSVTGFLGPNGAGKTTTVRMVLGLVHPTAGQATIGGLPYHRLHNPTLVVGAAPSRRASTRLAPCSDVVVVRTPTPDPLAAAVSSDGGTVAAADGNVLRISGLTLEAVGHLAFGAGVELHELSTLRSDLEDVFFALTAEEAAE